MFLADEREEHLQVMALEFMAALPREDLGIKWDKVRLGSTHRLGHATIRRRRFVADDDLAVFAVSAITRGVPEMDTRISLAWKAFQPVRCALVCRAFPWP